MKDNLASNLEMECKLTPKFGPLNEETEGQVEEMWSVLSFAGH